MTNQFVGKLKPSVGLQHLDPRCRFATSNDQTAAETILCVCMGTEELGLESVEERIYKAALETVKSDSSNPEFRINNVFKLLVATFNNDPDSLEENAKVIAKAKEQYVAQGKDLTFFRSSLMHREYSKKGGARLWDLLDAEPINFISQSVLKNAHKNWTDHWVRTGSTTQAETLFLETPGMWGAGQEASHAVSALTHQALALKHAEKLKRSVETLAVVAQNSGETVILVNNWTYYADAIKGTDAFHQMFMNSEYKIFGDVLALKCPKWAAVVFIEECEPSRSAKIEISRILVLDDPPEDWREAASTMFSLWRGNGGSFKFSLDVYGAQTHKEDYSYYFNAWRAAKALSEPPKVHIA